MCKHKILYRGWNQYHWNITWLNENTEVAIFYGYRLCNSYDSNKKIVSVFQSFLKGTGMSKYCVTNIIDRR